MDPKHEPSQGPSPDDPNRRPHGDKPEHDPQAAGKPPKSDKDPTAEPPQKVDSLVDLGLPGGPTDGDPNAPPPSGISVIEWAALVEEDPPTDTGETARIDAPSDADWFKEKFDPLQSADNEPIMLEHATDSDADLHDADHAGEEPTFIPGAASDTSFDEPDVLADDLEIVRSAFAVDSTDSVDQMKSAAPELEAADEELDLSHTGEVQLGAELPAVHDLFASAPPKPEGVDSNVYEAEAAESGVVLDADRDEQPADLSSISATSGVSGVALVDDSDVADETKSAGVSGVQLVDEAVITDDLAAAMLAGGEGAASDDSHSGRDLIAEQVESGVDLRGPIMDVTDEELEAEAGQAAAVEGDPSQAGTVESAVIEAQLVEDVVHDEAGDTVGLGESPKRQGTGSSVNLSGPPPKKRRPGDGETEETGDIELGAASGHLLNSGLDFSNVPEIDAPTSKPKAPKGLDPDEVDFGSDDEIRLPDRAVAALGAGDSDSGTAAATAPERAAGEPAKKQRAAAGVGGWIGGGLVGAVAATGACAALWYFGMLPRGEVKSSTTNQGANQAVVRPATFDAKLAHLRNGDFDRAGEAGIEQIDAANPEQLEARGEYRWLSYLKKQGVAGAPLKADDEPVMHALEDLDKVAKDETAKPEVVADALLWTGNIQEMTNNVPEARKTYTVAAGRFAGDAALKRRFDAARIRLDLRTPGKPAGVGRLPLDERDRLLLVALVEPVPPDLEQPPTAKQEPAEAGYDFWEAVELARKQNFAEALKKLQSARDLHDKRRFAQLRKSQNPTSDPTEEIFLRTCDELKVYWTMLARLRDGKYLNLTNRTDPDKALVELMGSGAASAKWFETQGRKLVAAKVIADPKDFEKGLDQLLADRKNAETEAARFTTLGEALVKAKVIDKPEDVDQGVTKLLADRTKAEKQIADLNAGVRTAQTEAKKQMDLVTAAEAKLKAADDLKKAIKKDLVDAKYLAPNAGDDKIVQGVKDAVKVATTDVNKAALQKVMAERDQARGQVEAATARTKEQLAQRWQPQEMLSLWLPLLEDRAQKGLPAKAVLDVERVTKDPEATPAQKARAEVIKGLALRNQEKYPEAKTALENAKASLAKDDKVWMAATDAALKEVSNPGAGYLHRADALQSQGKYDEAITALTHAIELLPAEKGNLLAKRSLVQLEAARAKTVDKLTGSEPLVVAAQKDAKAAADTGAALGHYASGRVAEELGQYDAAVQSYRQAVAAHPDPNGDGSLFRIALARLLLRSRPDRPAPKDSPKLGRLSIGEGEMSPETLAILLAFTLQPPLGQQPASVEEAVKLADDILKMDKSKVPYEVRAQAFAVKNLWTEALRTYAEGLRSNLDRTHADELMYLLNNHPKLKGPDSERIANPLMAEAHYSAGIRHYFNKQYADAEKEFAAAVKNESQDARYHYFLGLARLAQDKDEAYEDFVQGATLEARGRPARAAVSAALERVQGPVRTIINAAREKAR